MSAAYCRHCGARLAEPSEAFAGECHNAEACLVTELDRAGYDELAPLGQLSSEHAAIDDPERPEPWRMDDESIDAFQRQYRRGPSTTRRVFRALDRAAGGVR